MAINTTVPDRISIARETKVWFVSGATIATTNPLQSIADAAVSGAIISALMKSITITPPENQQELTSFMGVDANNFTNQLFQTKPATEAKLTGTLILDGNETFEPIFGGGPTAITGGFSRYQIGAINNVLTYDVVVSISGGTASRTVNFGLFRSIINKWGDVKLSGPDGHWEQDISVVTLPKNFYIEDKD